MQIAALLQDGALPFGRTMDYRKQVAAIYLLGFFIDLINMFITSAAIPAGARRAAYYGSKKVAIASLPTFYCQGLRRCFIVFCGGASITALFYTCWRVQNDRIKSLFRRRFKHPWIDP